MIEFYDKDRKKGDVGGSLGRDAASGRGVLVATEDSLSKNHHAKHLDIEEMWADDASEDDKEDNGEDDDNSEEDDIAQKGDDDGDDNN
ncbi:hypothetical protein DCAR_0520094 [Daucus carota subsp. sativus]|uniref:Uncharacterized protein n=1 Tax=Daucus carota subsp. sativus TaxID=79200 RepID=A0A161YL90_DAUCS|nr:hypothetical protein DCAR_0520094 [Daucus carota subsp. sativus]